MSTTTCGAKTLIHPSVSPDDLWPLPPSSLTLETSLGSILGGWPWVGAGSSVDTGFTILNEDLKLGAWGRNLLLPKSHQSINVQSGLLVWAFPVPT